MAETKDEHSSRRQFLHASIAAGIAGIAAARLNAGQLVGPLDDERLAQSVQRPPLKTGALLSPPLPPLGPRPAGIVIQLPPPAPPPVQGAKDFSAGISDWGVMKNDSIGDCVVACMGHAIEAWTANASKVVVTADSYILQMYSEVTGYDPKTGANDTGMLVSTGLEYWKQHGLNGHQLVGYERIYPEFTDDIRLCIQLFGCCILTLGVNAAMEDAFWSGKPWTSGMGPTTQYHCVPVVRYDATYVYCVTWGRIHPIHWNCFSPGSQLTQGRGFANDLLGALQPLRPYVFEAYVPVGLDWTHGDGRSPSGYSKDEMLSLATRLRLSQYPM